MANLCYVNIFVHYLKYVKDLNMKNNFLNKGCRKYVIVYLILSIPLLYFYRFFTTPDYISYVSIAETYIAGNFQDAVNAYWGPLFSWLMAPLLLFNCPSLIAGKIVLIIAGAAVLMLTSNLLTKLKVNGIAYQVSMWSMIPVTLYYVFLFLSPDLLLALCLLTATSLMISDKYETSKTYPIYIGLLGVLAYSAKQYGLLFFVANFLIFSLCLFVRTDKKLKVFINSFVVLIITLSISFICINVLHAKYGNWMIGSAGHYNIAIGPESSGQIHRVSGLIELPNESAVVAWEDPTFYEYRPRQLSLKTAGYFLSLGLKNLQTTIIAFTNISIFSFTILAFFFLMQINNYSNNQKNEIIKFRKNIFEFFKSFFTNKDWFLLFSFMIFTAGYLPVRADIRFLSFAVFLLIIMGGIGLQKILETSFFSDKFRTQMLILIYIASFAFYPCVELVNNANTGKYQYYIAKSIEKHFTKKNIRIATNLNWHDTLYIVAQLNGKYLGKTKSTEINDTLLKELNDYNIDCFLFWKKSDEPQNITGFEIINHQPKCNLTVYKKIF